MSHAHSCGCIDIHTHVVPENFPRRSAADNIPWPSMAAAHACHRHVLISGKHYRTVHEGSWSTARRITDMAAMEVGLQAMSPMPELLSYWLPLPEARQLLRFLNETIAAMVQEAPEHFCGLAAVPLQDVDAAIDELRYCIEQLGMRGVELASHVNGVSIGDPRFEPFFAYAASVGVPIFVADKNFKRPFSLAPGSGPSVEALTGHRRRSLCSTMAGRVAMTLLVYAHHRRRSRVYPDDLAASPRS